MYSKRLQEFTRSLGERTGSVQHALRMLEELLSSFAGTLGHVIDARVEPPIDSLQVSIKLMLLSRGVARLDPSSELDGIHYLVAMGLEQSGYLLARVDGDESRRAGGPLENDDWYRLMIAFLHYLAGGHRVQALSILRYLERKAKDVGVIEYAQDYTLSYLALKRLYMGRRLFQGERPGNMWEEMFLQPGNSDDVLRGRLMDLSRHIRHRREIMLSALGKEDAGAWLERRGVSYSAAEFWELYLEKLEQRGISTFTPEQVGDGFDVWLNPGEHLLVMLPTGAGKSIVGELRTALALAQGQQVVWILPTRALVRQAKRELRAAFESLDVLVEELPTTEDFDPLFADVDFAPKHISATTPEKLAALLRVNPDAMKNVGLVVFDEAQLVFDTARGPTAEFVLQRARNVEGCQIVLMSAFQDAQTSLERVLGVLCGEFRKLVAESRPTRRIYGVVTDTRQGSCYWPVVLLYPPGLQAEDGTTHRPVVLRPQRHKYRSRPSPLKNAQYFVRSAAKGGVRTILFVNDRRSAERQARNIANAVRTKFQLPRDDVARLDVELGRASALLGTARSGVISHHAAFSPLEQHVGESWVRDGVVTAVVATPTLAQGVNLPIDISIVSFTKRFNRRSKRNEDLSHAEVMNMLGRAGRAGYVSDGVCLLAIERERESPVKALDRSRRWFFHSADVDGQSLGLVKLMSKALQADVGRAGWVLDMKGLSFNEAQTIVSWAARASIGAMGSEEEWASELSTLPSMNSMPQGDVSKFAQALSSLGREIEHEVGDDALLAAALAHTGMPVDVLRVFLNALNASEEGVSEDELLMWADDLVKSALSTGVGREWYAELLKGVDLERMLGAISLWRNGSPMIHVEREFGFHVRDSENRSGVGIFWARKLGILSQFWGALAVCERLLKESRGEPRSQFLQNLPVFVREGAGTVGQLLWLRALGGLDRVLAHKLSEVIPLVGGSFGLRRAFIRGQLRRWRYGEDAIPVELEGELAGALNGVLQEVWPD